MRRAGRGLILVFALMLGVWGSGVLSQAAPAISDCASCHEGEAVLSPNHPPTVGMSWDDCASCHPDSDPDLNLAGSIPLSHLHELRGIDCADCHTNMPDGPPGEPEAGTCESCHGTMEDLAQVEWPDKPNPHDSHFPGLECTFCHHVHEPSYDFCLECHDFGYQIP